jgi:hypothetical protein
MILRPGLLAQQFCRSVARAHVEAVFERSLYLRHGDAFICLGGLDIGNGPLTLTGAIDVSRLALQPGDAAAVCARQITIGDAAFTLDGEAWRPPPWPACVPARLTEACAVLARRTASEAPQHLARDVFAARIKMFERWLFDSRDAAPPVHGLIGLGPGLTPSGDDFLVGALAALDAIGTRDAHAALATAVADAAGATSALSGCFLRAAAAGHVGEALHRATVALLTGDADAAIAAVAHIGHSSGWDMIAGSATVLRIAAGRHALAASYT